MIMRMTKGERTKKRIEDASRELFHEKGYRGTLVKDIIGKVQIAPGNLTYYFPTKDTITVELLCQYMENIAARIDETYPGIDAEKKTACSMLIFYHNIFMDKKTVDFFEEIIRRKNVHYMVHDKQIGMYEDILKESGINPSELDLKLFKATDVGARYELMTSYFDGKFKGVQIDRFVRMMFIITLMSLMGYAEKASVTMDEALIMVQEMKTDDLKLLV